MGFANKAKKLKASRSHPKHHGRRKSIPAGSTAKEKATGTTAKEKATGSTTKEKASARCAPPTKQHTQHRDPIIPFDVFDAILLIGEGDLSFTLSLLHDHGCANLTATTFDTCPQLLEKYPHAGDAIAQITAEDQTVLHGIDAARLGQAAGRAYKQLRSRGPFLRIFFMFPHVGGVSTDVNRQVRANQSLLAAFFEASQTLLAEDGTILVTLFEGEPYSLWNVRDLARHAGLVVVRSWRFESAVFPSYRHARTGGVVRKRDGGVSETAWKGEERGARCFEFALPEAEAVVKGKRKRLESDDDDD